MINARSFLATALCVFSLATASPTWAEKELPLGHSMNWRDPIRLHFEEDWRLTPMAERQLRLERIKERLSFCRDRLPAPSAKEYGLLKARATEAAKGLAALECDLNDVTAAGNTLYLLDALDGELSCREREGWDSGTERRLPGRLAAPECGEVRYSNLPLEFRRLDPGESAPERGGAGSCWTDDTLMFTGMYTNRHNQNALFTASDGTVYCAYRAYSPLKVIGLSRSTDAGQSWEVVFDYISNSPIIENPSVAVDPYSGKVFVVFDIYYDYLGNHDIMGLVKVGDTVNSFYIDNDSGDDRYPSVAIEYDEGADNVVYVAYEHLSSEDDREMHIVRSTDNGVSWSSWHTRGYGLTDHNVHCQVCATASHSNYVYVTYVHESDYDDQKNLMVEYGSRNSTNSTFEHQTKIYDASDNSDRGASWPVIVGSHGVGDNVVIAWQQAYSSTDDDVMFARSTDHGVSWTWSFIAATAENERYPAVTAAGVGSAGGNIYGDFGCTYFYSDGKQQQYRRSAYNDMQYWTASDDIQVDDGLGGITNGPRSGGVTMLRQDDSQWYPVVSCIDEYNTYMVTTTTKRAGVYTFNTSPTGLQLNIDGSAVTAPQTFDDWVRGNAYTVSAPLGQSGYTFSSWSDGGARVHSVITAATNTTITAYYTPSTPTVTNTPTVTRTPTRTPTRTVTPTPTPTADSFCSECQYSSSPNMMLYDNAINFDSLYVADWMIISNVTARVNIIHPNVSDLVLRLIHGSTSTTLSNRNGGSGDNYTFTVFDDAAAVSIVNGTAPFTGDYQPQESLTEHNGANARGTWYLYVNDMSVGYTGTLVDWQICFTSASPTPTQTPTRTPTQTPTRTQTQTPTRTPTRTPTLQATSTNSPTHSPTRTSTETPTRTPTDTPTNSPTDTPLLTETPEPTFTPTSVPTISPTSTNTFEATAAPSASAPTPQNIPANSAAGSAILTIVLGSFMALGYRRSV